MLFTVEEATSAEAKIKLQARQSITIFNKLFISGVSMPVNVYPHKTFSRKLTITVK